MPNDEYDSDMTGGDILTMALNMIAGGGKIALKGARLQRERQNLLDLKQDELKLKLSAENRARRKEAREIERFELEKNRAKDQSDHTRALTGQIKDKSANLGLESSEKLSLRLREAEKAKGDLLQKRQFARESFGSKEATARDVAEYDQAIDDLNSEIGRLKKAQIERKLKMTEGQKAMLREIQKQKDERGIFNILQQVDELGMPTEVQDYFFLEAEERKRIIERMRKIGQ